MARVVQLLVAVACLVAMAGTAVAQEAEKNRYVGQGSALIEDGNIDRARDIALQEARRAAVAKAGLAIAQHTEVFNNRFVTNHIVQKFSAVLEDETVLEEGKQEEGDHEIYVVRVRGRVSKAPLDRASLAAVDFMMKSQGRPRTALFIRPERADLPTGVLDTIEADLIGKLAESGFSIVNVAKAKELRERAYEFEQVLSGDADTLRGMARKDKFQYALLCTVGGDAKKLDGLDIVSGSVRVAWKVMETRTAENLTGGTVAADRKSTGTSEAEALTASARSVADTLHGTVKRGIALRIAAKYAGFPVYLEFENCPVLRAITIKKALKAIRGMQVSAPETVLSHTEIRGTYTFTPDLLLEQLVEAEFDDFALDFRVVEGGYMNISCTSK